MEETSQLAVTKTVATVETAVKKSPADFLKQVLGKPVIVQLNSGVTYRGVLACLDGFLNIAMEQTEEYVDGQLKNRYGDCFIRGNNGRYNIFVHVYMQKYNDCVMSITVYFFVGYYSFELWMINRLKT